MILVVAAIKTELEPYFDPNKDNAIYTGIGKINAAFTLTKALRNPAIDLVVNFGSAASPNIKNGTLVQCIRFFERDMVCHLTEYLDHNPKTIEEPIVFSVPSVEKVTCYTGDSFVPYCAIQEFSGGAVDMEAFALAKVCSKLHIPFLCFKTITDGKTPHSEDEWRANANQGAKQFKEIYDLIKDTRPAL